MPESFRRSSIRRVQLTFSSLEGAIIGASAENGECRMPQADASSIHSEPMIELLRELALDLGAVWNRYTDDIWRQIDPDVWLLTRNPWLMLHTRPTRSSSRWRRIKICVDVSKTLFSPGGRHRGRRVVPENSFRVGAKQYRVFQHGVRPERGAPDRLGGMGNVAAISSKRAAIWACRS